MKKQKTCLTVIIPVYNEEKTILSVFRSVQKQKIVNQIIIVNDGSTDNTKKELDKIKLSSKIKILHHDFNLGKGASINSAKKYISQPYLIIQDADLEYNPKEYNKMLEPLISGKADVVFGSRFQTSEPRRVLYFWHYLANKFLTIISNFCTNINLSDMETCYKAIRTPLFEQINLVEKRFGFEPEITVKLAALQAKFYEVSISYAGRTYSEGKKIKLKDAFRAIYCIFKYSLLK